MNRRAGAEAKEQQPTRPRLAPRRRFLYWRNGDLPRAEVYDESGAEVHCFWIDLDNERYEVALQDRDGSYYLDHLTGEIAKEVRTGGVRIVWDG